MWSLRECALFVLTVDTDAWASDVRSMAHRITMNISLSPQHKAFVKAQVASGRFRNDSEVLREGLRLLEDHDRQRRLEEKLLDGMIGEAQIHKDTEFWRSLVRRIIERAEEADRGEVRLF